MGSVFEVHREMILLIVAAATLAFLFWPIRAPGKVKIRDANVPQNEPSTYLTGPMPALSGFMLRLNCYLSNTRFGVWFLIPNTGRDDLLGLYFLEQLKSLFR